MRRLALGSSARALALPLLGFDQYAIEENVCKNIGYPAYPDCPIPLSLLSVVNIALMWVGAPLAAYLGKA